MKKIILILLLFVPLMVFGCVWANDVNLAFIPSTTVLKASSNQLDFLIPQAAVQFLKSNSDYMLFLQQYEQDNSNIPALQEALNNAIDNLKKASETYIEIKTISTQTPYNLEVLNLLSSFNYSRFQNVRGLIPDIFQTVRFFLIRGNITGVFNYMHKNLLEISNRLDKEKKLLDNGMIPNIKNLWDINQRYTNLMLFGQYASQVFKEIIK
ncbi:MAG: hypothetical protein ACM3SY_17495 [Candidatus Omnitrophota bacterium]